MHARNLFPFELHSFRELEMGLKSFPHDWTQRMEF